MSPLDDRATATRYLPAQASLDAVETGQSQSDIEPSPTLTDLVRSPLSGLRTSSTDAATGREPCAGLQRHDLAALPALRGAALPPTMCVMTGYDAAGAVDGPHLRAARAMLGWSQSDLARVSGLSLSTIRRLEDDTQAASIRNHRSAIDTLRTSGIRFLLLDDGTVALA